MTSRSWKHHFALFLIGSTTVLLAGWYFDQLAWTAFGGLSLYATWHVVHIWRMHAWLKNSVPETPKSVGLWADVFSRIKSMEQRNRKQKKRYRRMIGDFRNVTNAFPDATLIVDKNNRITWFNQAAGMFLELDEIKDMGRPISHILRHPDFESWLKHDKSKSGKLEMPAPGMENTWLEISAVSIQKGRRLIILRDVSEIHNLDQIRKDFVTNVSHELRTPLTVMRGYLEIMHDRPDDELSVPFSRMLTQAIQMQSMLDDLLELSRLQDVVAHGAFEKVDVPSMLRQLQEQAGEISRGQHELQFDIDPGLRLIGNRSDLESAFRNLIVNAMKYTPEGGRISVSWSNSERGPALAVVDTGIGIPQREIPRLTERFYRVSSDRGRQSGGTGLGLAIVKHVLFAHDAQLEIQSDYGVGSRFICTFPPRRIPSD
jgi:two-component system phosphate regulon sensor histidine kinase PhoR